MSRTVAAAALAAGSVLTAIAGHASTVNVVFSRASAGPTATAPGAADAAGNPVTANFNTMADFWLSPDGSRFLLRGFLNAPVANSDYLLLGSGLTGSVVLQEDRPFPGAVGAEVCDFFSGSVVYPFNANNDWCFAVRAKGGVNTVFQKVVRFNAAGAGVLRFQMGDLYTGMTDIPANPSGDERLGNSVSSLSLRNNGAILWQDPNPANCSSFRYPVTALDAVRFMQPNAADTVTRIDGSGPVGISRIATTGTISVLQTSPDGTRVVVRGSADLDASNTYTSANDPDIVVVDGAIKIQAAQPLPNDASVTVLAINQTFVAANNDWYARGTVTGGAWAVKNGTVIAKTGGAVGTDAWGTATFYTITGNSNGDWLVAGKTNRSDTASDDVVVVNGNVVLRENDPVQVDIDGDNVLDTVYVGRGNNTLAAFGPNNSAGIAPDGTVYIIANLRTADGADLAPTGQGYSLLRITPGTTCPGGCGNQDFNGDGDFGTDQDIEAFFACLGGNCCPSCFCGGSDFNGDGDFGTDQDIEAFFRVLGGGNC